MIYRLVLTPAIARQLARLSPSLKGQIRCALDEIRDDPYLGKVLKRELKGFYSYRVRHYRIVYSIHSKVIEIHVLAIGPRVSIYKTLM